MTERYQAFSVDVPWLITWEIDETINETVIAAEYVKCKEIYFLPVENTINLAENVSKT